MCKPVYAIDTPAGRIGIFEGDESEDFHGIRIFWIDENDAVIDLIATYPHGVPIVGLVVACSSGIASIETLEADTSGRSDPLAY